MLCFTVIHRPTVSTGFRLCWHPVDTVGLCHHQAPTAEFTCCCCSNNIIVYLCYHTTCLQHSFSMIISTEGALHRPANGILCKQSGYCSVLAFCQQSKQNNNLNQMKLPTKSNTGRTVGSCYVLVHI